MRRFRIQIELGYPLRHYHRELIRGIYNYAMVNCPNWTFISNAYDFLESFRPARSDADGVLIHAPYPNEFTQALLDERRPAINLALPERELPLPMVVPDETAIGQAAAIFLASLKIDRTLYVGPAYRRSHCRGKSFSETLVARGQAEPVCLFEDTSHASKSLLAHLRKTLRAAAPDQSSRRLGVFAFSDSFAYTVNQAACEVNMQVPRDLAILGVDNDELICELSRPPLSSIPLNSRLHGYQAAKNLHGLLEGKEIPQITLIPPLHIVERLSTHYLKVDDPIINTALNIMYDRVHTGVQVGEIVAKLPVSRRTFEYRFRELIGCSPHEEIQKIRLARAIRLLQEGEMSNHEIAIACGYNNSKHLDQTMRKYQGKRINDFRLSLAK